MSVSVQNPYAGFMPTPTPLEDIRKGPAIPTEQELRARASQQPDGIRQLNDNFAQGQERLSYAQTRTRDMFEDKHVNGIITDAQGNQRTKPFYNLPGRMQKRWTSFSESAAAAFQQPRKWLNERYLKLVKAVAPSILAAHPLGKALGQILRAWK